MRILRTYLLKELFWPFIFSLAILVFFMLTVSMFVGKANIFGLIIGKGISLSLVLKLILLNFPNLLSWAIPFSLLISTLLVIGRLAADNEIIAIRASGVNLYKLCLPIIVGGFLISLASIPLNDRIKPNALFAIRKLGKQIGFENPTAFLEPGTFIRTFQGYIIFIHEIQDERLQNIRIYQPQPGKPTRTIIADQGEFKARSDKNIIELKLMDGSSDEPNPQNADEFYKLKFKTYYLTLPVSSGAENMQKKLKDMSIKELLRENARLRKDKIEDHAPITEINKKISFSFSCFAFVLIGLPLAIWTRKKEKLFGIGIAVGIFLAYYILFLVGETFSRKGFIYPGLGVWLSDVILMFMGLILIARTMKR